MRWPGSVSDRASPPSGHSPSRTLRLDVYAALSTNVWPDLSAETASDAPPAELASHVASGTLGVKTGAGTYPWPPEQVQAVTARRNRALGDALRGMRDD